jgi:hypothetical protein
MADRMKKNKTNNIMINKNGSIEGVQQANHSGHNSVGSTKIKDIFPNVQRIGGNKSVQ